MKGGSCECDIHGKRENYDRGEGGEIEYHKKEKSEIKGWAKMRQWEGQAGTKNTKKYSGIEPERERGWVDMMQVQKKKAVLYDLKKSYSAWFVPLTLTDMDRGRYHPTQEGRPRSAMSLILTLRINWRVNQPNSINNTLSSPSLSRLQKL